jgi:Fic family protein
VATARDLFQLVSMDRERLLARPDTALAAIRLFERLPTHPVVTSSSVMRVLATTRPTASRAIETLVDARVLLETTGRRRDRAFAYDAYLARLRDGTELGDAR